jgi:hypothetical protein
MGRTPRYYTQLLKKKKLTCILNLVYMGEKERERESEREREKAHISIKLANEAGEVVVLEIFRQQELGELGRRPYNKPSSLSIP